MRGVRRDRPGRPINPVDPVEGDPVDGDPLYPPDGPDPLDTLGALADLLESHPDPRLGADLDRALAEYEATGRLGVMAELDLVRWRRTFGGSRPVRRPGG